MPKSSIVLAFLWFCLAGGLQAQSDSVAATTSQQKLVVRYFHEVLDGRKVDVVDQLFQPDCVLHFGARDVKGLSEVHGMAERVNASYSKLTTQIHDIIESGDRVVVRITHRATGGGPVRSRLGTHDGNGKNFEWDAVVIFRMKDGKIAEDWVTRDELGMLLSAGFLQAK